jgi:hypothetical protein
MGLSVVLDERYADLAAQFQRAQIGMLRRTLKKHGIVGTTAKEICGEFSFDLAMLFDQGELELGSAGYRRAWHSLPTKKPSIFSPLTSSTTSTFGTTAEIFESKKP